MLLLTDGLCAADAGQQGAYGAPMYMPYPDMPPYPMPPGYMGSPSGPAGGPHGQGFDTMEGAPPYPPGPHGSPPRHPQQHPHQAPEEPASPWANMGKHAKRQEEGRSRQFMSGVANLYGGMDESERRRKEDARSAYVHELNEQVPAHTLGRPAPAHPAAHAFPPPHCNPTLAAPAYLTPNRPHRHMPAARWAHYGVPYHAIPLCTVFRVSF